MICCIPELMIGAVEAEVQRIWCEYFHGGEELYYVLIFWYVPTLLSKHLCYEIEAKARGYTYEFSLTTRMFSARITETGVKYLFH